MSLVVYDSHGLKRKGAGMSKHFAGCAAARTYLVSAIIACLSMIGCIPVGDFGAYWDKGVLDPDLEGHWKQKGVAFRSQDQYSSFEKVDTYYRHKSISVDRPRRGKGFPEIEQQARTLMAGKYRFLMVRYLQHALSEKEGQAADKMPPKWVCGLVRYAIENGELQVYALKDNALARAIREKRINGEIPGKPEPDTLDLSVPSITLLDEKTVQTLAVLANKADNWKATTRYVRVKDLEKALAQSRTYPAKKDTPANTRVMISMPALQYLARDKSHILLRHLQASPEWKVFDQGGETVCYRRKLEDGRWQVSLNGFRSSSSPQWQERYLFRFSKNAGGPFTKFHYFTKVGPMAGEVHLKLESSDQGIESYLAVGERRLWFEFFEQTPNETRARTREALIWLQNLADKIKAAEAEIKKVGYAAKLMPAGVVTKGKPSIEIRDGSQGGIYDVFAWVNPGADGMVYLKVFDVKTNDRLSGPRIKQNSNEGIGWSGSKDELFGYNAQVTVYEGDWDHSYDARFELWFKDRQTGNERKLIEKVRTIVGWQR